MLKGSFSILEALEHLFAPQLLLVNLNKNHYLGSELSIYICLFFRVVHVKSFLEAVQDL